MAKLTFITIDFDETTLEEYEILYVEKFSELNQKIIMATRVSVLECISNLTKKKLIMINDNVINEKGFWSYLEDIKENIIIYIKVNCIEDIPTNLLKNSTILVEEPIIKLKRKINRKVIHKYREFMLDLSYIEAFVKMDDIILEKLKRKYLLFFLIFIGLPLTIFKIFLLILKLYFQLSIFYHIFLNFFYYVIL